jgi:hypothetical protein
MLRHARRKKILAETLQGAEIPKGATVPGMGERWGRPVEEQVAVLLPAESLRLMTEKIVRGIFHVQDGVFIELPYKIDFYVLPDDVAAEWSVILDKLCLLRFIVWSFPRARLQFTLDQFKGATSRAF